MKKILVLNGPNLNRLGTREPTIYGSLTLSDLERRLEDRASELSVAVHCYQSNHEGMIIDQLHEADSQYDGVIINAGAFTHYSYAIRDAIASISIPAIEVHISNIHAREAFRHESVIAPVTKGQIVGLGFYGYELALLALIQNAKGEK